MLRRCTKCHSEFPATTEFFYAAQQGRLRGECKRCVARMHAAIYQRNKPERDAANKEWVRTHPDRRRSHLTRYRRANQDKCKAAVTEWFAKDPEHARKVNRIKTKRWYDRHLDHARDVRRAAVKKRRALKRGAGESSLTRHEWQSIKELYDYRCAYCDQKKPLTQDHVIPLRHGGNHSKNNVVPACMTCNCSKGTASPPVPIHRLKFLS